LKISDGELLAVNGPPGTGKTTLLQSVVANAVVESALRGEAPYIIAVSSTNNQAIENIIESFTRAGTKPGKLAGRSLSKKNRWKKRKRNWMTLTACLKTWRMPKNNGKSGKIEIR
jgi:KaiC/GvpD/RAD55 family RecA-like ATPase